MLYLLLFDRIFCGEPVPTSPENALKAHRPRHRIQINEIRSALHLLF
jgi:hypothetical protein